MKRRNKNSVVMLIAIVCVVGVIGFVGIHAYAGREDIHNIDATGTLLEEDKLGAIQPVENLPLSLDIEDYYTINTGDPSNLFYIDENKVLWGCGRNDYGQLGQGTQDFDFHEDMVKIADNVLHVDYSQNGFVIYLTEDHKLYGVGMAAGFGNLEHYEEIDWNLFGANSTHYVQTTPCLLMENVVYARCGRNDVVILTEDASVWIQGLIGYDRTVVYYEPEPVKVLEDAVLVTGGFFNHAALLRDGSVWTWGYNYAGSCGVAGESIVAEPTKVADDVVMVWTDSQKINVDCYDIAEFEGIYERAMENTIIQKRDGTYWICGANVGTDEKVIPVYYEVNNYLLICTHEFLPYETMEQ